MTEPDSKSHIVIAWLENHPKAIMVLHAARRRARERNCKWCVAYIQTPSRFLAVEDPMNEHMLRLCTLAEQMGAEVWHLQADSVEQGLTTLMQAEKDRVELFLVGSMDPAQPFKKLRRRELSWEHVVRIASQYARVEVIPLSGMFPNKIRWSGWAWPHVHPLHFLYALAGTGAAFLAAQGLEWLLPPALFRVNTQNVSLLFMAACAFVAGRYGLLPGVTAAIASFLTYNYFYMPPYYELRITSVTEALSMGIFLSAGVLIALFTSRARSYAENVARRERSTQALFTLYRLASTAFSRQQVLETLQTKLSQMLDIDVAFFLPPTLNPDSIEVAVPAGLTLEEEDRRGLETAWNEMKTTGLASPLHTNSSWRFEPMIAPGGKIGVLAVRPKSRKKLDMWLGSLLTNIADQTAVLIEHIELERSMEATRIREEREKLRSMLLSSVSHDLKTPLAGIIGSLSVYRSVGERLTAARRSELLEGALGEAQRLDSFITNILDMTRLESGKIDFRPEWNDMTSIIRRVVKHMQHRLHQRPLIVNSCPPGLEVYMDAMMTEQVLQNLVDNACKYTPDGTRIEISCMVDQEKGFQCEVRDHGKGIPEDKLSQVFDKYARLKKEDSQVAGTGLGLAICRAIMEAQGGWVTATNHPEGGALFTFWLPQWRKAEPLSSMEEVA